jgi:glycerophosphoryl diester phosphodiesterase
MSRPRLAAHRGGAALWPENSLAAFRNAIALEVPLLEFDVHLTADGEIVVIHDRTLERTTDGAGPVVEHRRDELARVRLRGPDGRLTDERLPTFDEVLSLVAPSSVELLVEVKTPSIAVVYERHRGRVGAVSGPRYEGLEERLVAALGRRGLASRATIMAFNPEVLTTVRALAPRLGTTLLVGQTPLALASARAEDTIGLAVDLGAADIGFEHVLVDAPVVAAVRRAGLTIGVWTVNDEATVRRFAELDVDVVTTDRPDVAREVLGRGRGPRTAPASRSMTE